jgi:hypothetical protein
MRNALLLCLLLPLACDPPVDHVEPREAPDVPWPSVSLDGPVEGPDLAGAVLSSCFDSTLVADPLESDAGDPPCPTCTALVSYIDDPPDDDDRQHAQLCVSWSAHLDRQDCIRRALTKAGLVPVPLEVP